MNIKLLLLTIGALMTNPAGGVTLENFDEAFGLLGDPVAVEVKLTELLPEAKVMQEQSIYLQILSQIALAQAIQRKFAEAHETLDKAETELTPETKLAKARIFLERGRVFQQSEDTANARKYFEASFNLSVDNGLDLYAIDAAHMIAIIAEDNAEKIRWNNSAVDLAQETTNLRARRWLGSLYSNLGHNYLEAKRFEEALDVFTQTLKHREEEGHVVNIRIAKWTIGCALRSLGRLDEALHAQLELAQEYEALNKSGNLGMPAGVFWSVRGFVYEELAELYEAKAKQFAGLAFVDLSMSKDPLFIKSVSKRIDRLKQIKERLA